MKTKKLHLLLVLLIFNLFFCTLATQNDHTNYCEETSNPNSSISSSLLGNLTLCKSKNLYFRTSLGLFPVASVDYNKRLLTISHSSCSSSSLQYVSPLAITAGFPSPPQPNSLLLFNCKITKQEYYISPFIRNCTGLLHKCGPADSCLIVDDIEKVDKGFHPKDLNCSRYSWVHKTTSGIGEDGGYNTGIKVTFDIPAHVPDLCKDCRKSDESCGAGLKCVCHAKECSKFSEI